jgi:8-oxo-dGTP diphosphatase
MSNKPGTFDEQALFERKKRYMGFRHCPRCASRLIEAKLDGRMRLACSSSSCDFVYYHNPIPAAGAVIVENDRILLVRRAHPPRIGDWTIPAGFMEWDEHPTQTAIREVKEETGLDIELTGLFEVYSGRDDWRNNAVLILYLARRTGGELAPGDDASEAVFFPFDATPGNIAFRSHRQALADYHERYRRK